MYHNLFVIWDCCSKLNVWSVCRYIWSCFTVPVIVSPTENVPEIISISSNFGTQYLVTFTPSKTIILDCGLNPFPSKDTFLDLIVGVTSVLITLSPNDVLSNCSVINCREPDLMMYSFLRSVNLS